MQPTQRSVSISLSFTYNLNMFETQLKVNIETSAKISLEISEANEHESAYKIENTILPCM